MYQVTAQSPELGYTQCNCKTRKEAEGALIRLARKYDKASIESQWSEDAFKLTFVNWGSNKP